MHRGVLSLALLLASGCGFAPERDHWSDPKVAPLRDAIAEVDRAALGFTPIDPSSDIRLEIAGGRAYDAMLHICGKTDRTISFRKTGARYVWIGEQEGHPGPLEFETPDGAIREEITLTYETAAISGYPIRVLNVTYLGPRNELASKSSLSYADVSAYLVSWARSERACAT